MDILEWGTTFVIHYGWDISKHFFFYACSTVSSCHGRFGLKALQCPWGQDEGYVCEFKVGSGDGNSKLICRKQVKGRIKLEHLVYKYPVIDAYGTKCKLLWDHNLRA